VALAVWYGPILVAVLVGFGLTAYQLERNRQFRRIDDERTAHGCFGRRIAPWTAPRGGRGRDAFDRRHRTKCKEGPPGRDFVRRPV